MIAFAFDICASLSNASLKKSLTPKNFVDKNEIIIA